MLSLINIKKTPTKQHQHEKNKLSNKAMTLQNSTLLTTVGVVLFVGS